MRLRTGEPVGRLQPAHVRHLDDQSRILATRRSGHRVGKRQGAASVRVRKYGRTQNELVELVVRVGVRVAHHLQATERADPRTEGDVAGAVSVVLYA